MQGLRFGHVAPQVGQGGGRACITVAVAVRARVSRLGLWRPRADPLVERLGATVPGVAVEAKPLGEAIPTDVVVTERLVEQRRERLPKRDRHAAVDDVVVYRPVDQDGPAARGLGEDLAQYTTGARGPAHRV